MMKVTLTEHVMEMSLEHTSMEYSTITISDVNF